MNKKKLTLSVDERLSKRAKSLARERGTSVSQLVETFFASLEASPDQDASARQEEAPASAGEPSEETLSDWARRWRGGFAEEGKKYPDDPEWEERLLADEVADKHE